MRQKKSVGQPDLQYASIAIIKIIVPVIDPFRESTSQLLRIMVPPTYHRWDLTL